MADELLTLAPKEDLDSNQSSFRPYREHLDQVYREPSIRNIAVIGNRGSGKSSILRSYDRSRHFGASKFIFVSLIDFEEKKKTAKADDAKADDAAPDSQQTQKRLEYSLLCQILARCTSRDLRGSTLSGIPEPPPDLRLMAPWLTAVFALVFGLMFEDRAGSVLKAWGWSTQARVILHGILYLILGVLLCAGVFRLLKAVLPDLRLQKLSLKGTHAEAELALEKGKYCLDQFKFEIIHILNQIADKIGCTVVFEDMERLDSAVCVQIMTKLRELNGLVNTHRMTLNPNAEPVRFIYALSDEVFDYEARTKFFDTIVPVIPVLNAFNSEQVLKNHLSPFGIFTGDGAPIQAIISVIAPALTDYRTLRNVITEFDLLRKNYHSSNMPPLRSDADIRLLALAVYKGLFPKEYHKAFAPHGNAVLPVPTADTHHPSFVSVAQQLFDRQWLDNSTMEMVGYSIQQIQDQWHSILTSGDSTSKLNLLFRFLGDESRNSADGKLFAQTVQNADGIFDVLANEEDPSVASLMGHFLYQDACQALSALVASISVPGLVKPHKFINRLACLPTHNKPELQEAIDAYAAAAGENALANMCIECLKRLDFEKIVTLDSSQFGDIQIQIGVPGRWTNGPHIDALCMCLGAKRHDLPTSVQEKKIGKKTIREHIEAYEEREKAPSPQ